jgi:hypothetical protein
LAELRIREASLEHALDDVDQARVDRICAFLGSVASLDVLVDRFGCGGGSAAKRGRNTDSSRGDVRVSVFSRAKNNTDRRGTTGREARGGARGDVLSMVCTKSVVSLTSKSEPAHSA